MTGLRVYHIFIDRFSGGNLRLNWRKPQFIGGNLKSIIPKLEYIKSLGFNAIWLSPFYETTDYHGYHITNYFKVDQRFGSVEILKELIDRAHDLEIKVIADFVPNHCSIEHPFFKEAIENKKSPYRKWFYFSLSGKYKKFMGFAELAKWNLRNRRAADHLLDSAVFWLNLGFDGFRIDHVVGLPWKFLMNLNQVVKQKNPDFLLIGEAWLQGIEFKYLNLIDVRGKYFRFFTRSLNQEFIQKYYAKVLDGVLDFGFRDILIGNLAWRENPDYVKIEQLKINHFKKYPLNYQLWQFLDNHDTNRFIFECGGDTEKLKEAFQILISTNMPVVLYNGTELGMSNQKNVFSGLPFADIYAREPIHWKHNYQPLLFFNADTHI